MVYNQKQKYLLALIIFGFILIGALAIHTYGVQKKVYLDGVDKQLKLAAESTEIYLGKDFIDRYTKENPPSDDVYHNYLSTLSTLAQTNGIDYVYMMNQDHKGIHIVFSSSTFEELKEDDFDPFYTPYEASKNVIQGFKDTKAFYVSESDKYGTFRSYCKYAYSPDGKLYMVGADISLDVIKKFIDDLFQFYLYVFGILILLVSSIFYIYFAMFQKNRHLNKLALNDKLTKLYNRQKLDDILLEEQNMVDASDDYHCGCLLIDIDHFKMINDNYGHLQGDKILQDISNLMQNFFRSNDIVGRWGGEEFLVLLPSTKLEDAIFLAEKLCRSVEAHFIHTTIPVTISIGVGNLSKNLSIREALNDIDMALYLAKKNGRNQIQPVGNVTSGS